MWFGHSVDIVVKAVPQFIWNDLYPDIVPVATSALQCVVFFASVDITLVDASWIV